MKKKVTVPVSTDMETAAVAGAQFLDSAQWRQIRHVIPGWLDPRRTKATGPCRPTGSPVRFCASITACHHGGR